MTAAQAVWAGGRMTAGPVIEPVLPVNTPVLAAPGLTSPSLSLGLPPAAPRLAVMPSVAPAPIVVLQAVAAPQAIAAPIAQPAKEKPPVFESLVEGVQQLGKASPSQSPAVLQHLFTGAKAQGALNSVAEPVGAQVTGRSRSRLLPAAKQAETSKPLAGPRPIDADGARMAAAIRSVQGRSSVELDFVPSPNSLKAISQLPYEVFLYRERATGIWKMTKGDQLSVAGDFGDYDMGLHNHVDIRMGLHSVYTPYPQPDDLVTGAGKDARLFVISVDGVAEWNPHVPFPDEPERFLTAENAGQWNQQFHTGSFWRRLVMRLSFPSGYPTLAKSLGVAMELRPWKKVSQDWLLEGKAPHSWATLARSLKPALAQEAAVAARRFLGRELSAAEAEDVAAKTHFMPLTWRQINHEYGGMMMSHPDGVAKPDLSITLVVRNGFESYASPEEHFRILFAHEYTHRLQFEKAVSTRHGIEIPAVAVELLRALELTTLAGLKSGRVAFIGPGVLASFEDGRRWAGQPSADETPFYHKGFLAGAAHALAARTGRPDDAWEFVRRVESAKTPENPGAVLADILRRP